MPKKILIIVSSILTIAVLGFCIYLYSLVDSMGKDDMIRWDNQQDVNQNLIKSTRQ